MPSITLEFSSLRAIKERTISQGGIPLRYSRLVVAACASAAIASTSIAGVSSYDLEYAIPSAGGAVASSTKYDIVGLVTVEGAATSPSTSSRYSIEPVVGGSAPEAAVNDWMIY